MKTYIDLIEDVAAEDIKELRRKDAEYGGSWKKRGGVGAWMMACRKWDRAETQLEKLGYNVFLAMKGDQRPEGLIDDIRDLRRYLLLIEAEVAVQLQAEKDKMNQVAGPPV